MTFCERLKDLFDELIWIFAPQYKGDYGWLVFLAFMFVAFISRKEFGGFLKAIWSLFWLVFFMFLLHSINEKLFWGFLGIVALAMFGGKLFGSVMKIAIWGIILGAILLAINNNFRVW